ncbi:MAG: hypothetical protein JO073_01025 [Actinobacteria bacterium]|nr:hypothetical protein [Actinomycetota bacterium]
MGSRSAAALLQLPVRLHGIRLGQPVDVLLETGEWRVLGFVVLCGDDVQRFLPIAAAVLAEGEVEVGSALLLLEDVDFYRRRAASLRGLLGGAVTRGASPIGPLRDVLTGDDGTIAALVVEREGEMEQVDPHGAVVTPGRAAA